MLNKPPSGTVIFLFTDIEGSTQWWENHPEWMQQAFVRQEKTLRAVAATHAGYVYKMIGDAFQIAFSTALDALTAAVDAQRQLQAGSWGEFGPCEFEWRSIPASQMSVKMIMWAPFSIDWGGC